MLIILYAILPVFLLIALGYGLKHFKFLGKDLFSGLEHLCYYFLFPPLIIQTLADSDFKSLEINNFLTVTMLNLFLVIGFAVLIYPIAKKLNLNGGKYSSLFQGITRWHGFIALTIAANLFPTQGIVYITIILATYTPILSTINVIVLSLTAQNQGFSILGLLSKIILNPVVYSCLIGLMLNVTGFELPTIVSNIFNLLGRSAMGLSLIALGGALVLTHVKSSFKIITFSVVVKLLLVPLSMFIIGKWLGLEGIGFAIALIAASVPTASSGYILARKMGGDAILLANIISIQTILSLFTMPLILHYSTAI